MSHLDKIKSFVSDFDYETSQNLQRLSSEEVATVLPMDFTAPSTSTVSGGSFSVATSSSESGNQEELLSVYPKVDKRFRSRYGPEIAEKMQGMDPETRKKLRHMLNERIRRPERKREQEEKIRAPLLDQISVLQQQVSLLQQQMMFLGGANRALFDRLVSLHTHGYYIQCTNCETVLSGLRIECPGETRDPTDTRVLRRVWRPF